MSDPITTLLPLAQLPDNLNLPEGFLKSLPVAGMILLGAILVRMLLNRLLSVAVDRTSLEEGTVRPVRTLITYIVGFAALAAILGVFGYHLESLWTTLTTVLAMIAIGFIAVWSVLSNVSCTLVILFTRPFAVGDVLEFPGEAVKGKVVDLTFMHTTLRDDDGSLLRIPNNMLYQKTLRITAGKPSRTLAEQLSRAEPTD